MRTTADEHLDVLIVGAGLSGIGAACHLRRELPQLDFQILEGRERIGGTWDLFRYPGIRSDSDMHTLGYTFSPWREAQAIADGSSILDYVKRTADQYGVTDRIRFGCRVVAANWSTEHQRWTVEVRRADPDPDSEESEYLTCSFLFACCGYYDYERGYTPEFPGLDRFAGTVVHPQHWPDGLEYDGKRVVVIGSGATAITLVPALAPRTEHVTMLQRSPSYVVSLPGSDRLAELARHRLPEKLAYRLIRAKNVALMTLGYQLSRRRPALMRKVIARGVRSQLPDGFDVDTHFRPSYNPWDQRLCVCPDGDLFAALSDGSASVVTHRNETFTETGIKLRSGRELEADVVVTATGLQLRVFGAIRLSIDERPVTLPDRLVYMGSMLSGVPNFAFVVGYTNASWTLRADVSCTYVCRLLRHLREHGYDSCVPAEAAPDVVREPLLGLNSGYVLRSIEEFPGQGSEAPWRVRQNYALDRIELARHRIDDGVMRFQRRVPASEPVQPQGSPAAV